MAVALPSWPNIQSGNTGNNVIALQCLLNFRGAALTIDGNFGSGTKTAVINYQKANGLTQDGVAGQGTLSKIIATVQQGTNNLSAKAAQYLLNKYNFGLATDGNFGTASNTAIRDFQSKMSITVDGIIGATSWQYLFGYIGAYPPPSGTTTSGYIRPIRASILAISNGREFGALRDDGRYHAAIDFYVNNGKGTPVYAASAGKVLLNAAFWAGTNELQVLNTDGTILRYCEISSSLAAGTTVSKGQQIATIIPNTAAGNGGTMLHLEYYKNTVSGSLTNTSNTVYDYVPAKNYQRRRDLLNPSSFATLPIS